MTPGKPEVIIFDVNETLLDLEDLVRSVEEALETGENTASLWFETMLHYSLVLTLIDNYQPFAEVGAASLVMVAQTYGIELSIGEARTIMEPLREAPAHPEVPAALEDLNNQGYSLAALTNSSRANMEAKLDNAGIAGSFEQQLSVEDIGLYKPHPHVYRWAARKLSVDPEQCLFVAAHGWDVMGAMSVGMDAAFLSRPGQFTYPLGPQPDYVEPDLQTLSSRLP